MHAHKLSISLTEEQANFIKNYKIEHHCKTRSAVIKKAIYLLQQVELAACYREANQEIDDIFEITNLDGIEDDETR